MSGQMARRGRRSAAVLAILALGAIALAGCGTSSSDGGGDTPAQISAKVGGSMAYSTFYSGDSEARRLLDSTAVWCRWSGDEVEMGATFTNGLAAHITVHVQPNYRLLRAGLHGDGLGSIKDVGIDANATRRWTAKLGRPEGVGGQPPISECAPEINSIELG